LINISHPVAVSWFPSYSIGTPIFNSVGLAAVEEVEEEDDPRVGKGFAGFFLVDVGAEKDMVKDGCGDPRGESAEDSNLKRGSEVLSDSGVFGLVEGGPSVVVWSSSEDEDGSGVWVQRPNGITQGLFFWDEMVVH